MMRYPLKSSFAEQIRSFVDYKNSLGFPYDESCRILWKFDNFCAERFPEKDSLDRELALAWLEKRDTTENCWAAVPKRTAMPIPC